GVDDDDFEEDDYNPDDDGTQDDTGEGDDPDAGTVTKKIQLVDGAPKTDMTSSVKQLKTSVLSSGERTAVKEGSDAEIKLRVQDISGSVSQADKQVVFAALGDYKVAEYLDITLWSTVGNGEEKQITSTNNSIAITVTVPESIRKAPNGKVRKFAFVRVHNGSGTVLQDKDSSANTVTVNSSRFSVYALAYRDDTASSSDSDSGGSGNSSASSGGGSKGSSGSGGGTTSYSGSGGGYGTRNYGVETDGNTGSYPETGDNAPIVPMIIGFVVALLGMIAVVIIKRRLSYEWIYVDENGNVIENYEEQKKEQQK
ncbi:MAG: LPXTG cell wall anchor domain-containing protein, partial [Eubacterium sp.]|nr:LPXTG cell wall anchor domain-containing protein [Eubacterium sp.]